MSWSETLAGLSPSLWDPGALLEFLGLDKDTALEYGLQELARVLRVVGLGLGWCLSDGNPRKL